MTPYIMLMPAATPAPTPSIKESVSDTSRNNAAKKSSSADKSSDIDQKKDDDREKISSDPTLFEQLMASLLNMPSPAQNIPAVTSGSDTDTSVSATSQFNAAFNMDPAMLVIPQAGSGAASAADASGFNAELLSALTPGIPAPTQDQTALMSQIESAASVTVPVPTLPADSTTTSALTVSQDTVADPRLVACGFNPEQMEALKTKLASLAAAKTDAQANQAQTPVQTDSGVISVSFTHPKPVVVTPQVVTAPAADASITSAQTAETVLSSAIAVNANVKTATSAEASDAAEQQAVLSGESFDPVEFRIAQSFQRPVSPPQAPAQSTSSNTSSTTVSTLPMQTPVGNQTAQHAVNTNVSGHVNTMNSDTSSSMFSSLLPQAIDAQAADPSLTASPAALPVTVSPLTSTVVQSTSAAQSHPAVQAVAAVIARNAKEGSAQTISMRLDPPQLGKLQVEMKYKKGDPLKVHVVLEKADTASMFQRDSHALESALKDAGLQLDGSSLSFEFSGDGSFQQALGQDGANSPQTVSASGTPVANDLSPLESTPDVYTDIKTGLTHYNLRV